MATKRKRVTRTPTKRSVRLGSMAIPPRAQREFKQYWADDLLSKFDPDDLGLLLLSFRRGVYYVIDGQHRLAALKAWLGDGWEDQEIECEVYEGLTEAQEAELFLRRNRRLSVNKYAEFCIAVNAGRPTETRIKTLVEHEGLHIAQDKQSGAIGAVGTLTRVFKRTTEDNFSRTLRIIRDAYGDSGLDSTVIDGIGHLCQRYNGLLDEELAVSRLSHAHGGVNGLLNRAATLKEKHGSQTAHCVAAAAVDIINRQAPRGKKLPSWWKSS